MGSESCRPNRGSRNGVCVGGWGEGSPPGAPPNPMGDPEAADSDSDSFSGRPPDPCAVDPWARARGIARGTGSYPKNPPEIGPITLPQAVKHTVRKEIEFPREWRVLRPRGTPKPKF